MTNANHQIARDFIAALATGVFRDDLLTDDMTGWTTGGTSDKARFLGAMKIFTGLFSRLDYKVISLTAEEDRVAAEVHSEGTFLDGEPFQNVHIYLLRIRDGRVAHMTEHMNELIIQEKILPRMMAAMGQGGAG
jgi:ketosteroid isomerase-like protein